MYTYVHTHTHTHPDTHTPGHTQAHTYLSNSLIQLNMMTSFWNDLQAEDKALFCGSLPFPSSLSSSHKMNLKDW